MAITSINVSYFRNRLYDILDSHGLIDHIANTDKDFDIIKEITAALLDAVDQRKQQNLSEVTKDV